MNIKQFLDDEGISYEINVDLKTKTRIKRGGIASIWVQPSQISVFEKIIIFCQKHHLSYEVIGNTSNCYFLNDYNPQFVVSTIKLNQLSVNYDRKTINCSCGYNMTRFARYCVENGYKGYEGFVGIPGTVGGAVINNSGCYGSLISELVLEITVIKDGHKNTLNNKDLKYEHRNSVLKSREINAVVLNAVFSIKDREDPERLKNKAKEILTHRMTCQEHTHPNLGSTYAQLEFKQLPFLKRLINAVVIRIINATTTSEAKSLKIKTKLFLYLRNAGSFRKYVSEFGIRCFTWKDSDADNAFKDYVEFINDNTIKSKMEIEIKQNITQ